MLSRNTFDIQETSDLCDCFYLISRHSNHASFGADLSFEAETFRNCFPRRI